MQAMSANEMSAPDSRKSNDLAQGVLTSLDRELARDVAFREERGWRFRMFGLGFGEISIILLIVLLLFGGSKLPDLGRGLGKAIREFRRSSSESDAIDVTKDKKDKP